MGEAGIGLEDFRSGFSGLETCPNPLLDAQQLLGILDDLGRNRGGHDHNPVAIGQHNDQEFAAQMSPSITTVRVRRREIGAIAGDLVLARLEGRTVADTRIDVGFEIIVRESG
jgi:DNA-binding LacI/PurR family transcriptional regulator